MKNIQIDTEAFIVLRELIGNTGTTLDEFFKTYEKGLNESGKSFDDMYDGFKNIQGLFRTTGITFDLPDMEGMFVFNMAPLGKAVSMLYNYKMTWEEISKTKFMTDEEIAKVKEIISILAGHGYDIEDLAKYFGFMKDSLSEVKTLGNLIGDLFKSIGDDIASTMADSFAEMALSGRVAMQELESYNKGLTNDFRTSAEIREDASANMWNNILLDTARAVIEFGIKMLAMAGMILIADAISGGTLIPLIKGTAGAADLASNFANFIFDIFGVFYYPFNYFSWKRVYIT